MANYREILRLRSLGISNKQISAACHCSRTTVIDVLKRAGETSLEWGSAKDLSDKEITDRLFPPGLQKPCYKMPDYGEIHKEMGKNGVTLSLLWAEYCSQCRETGEIPYQSTQFNKYYRDYVIKNNATMHLDHKPGEIMEVDWAGQNVCITDTDTGASIKSYVFVAVLPYSGYAYVEAFISQNQESWTTAHVNAYKYFGGVTRILRPDNLKTGVTSVSKSETVINRTYLELAEHYGTAVIPARPRSPRDKATVECSVGIVSTWILASLRNIQFLSLHELNEAIAEKLIEFNNKPFQKKEGSRAAAFSEEKIFLLPLPPHPYELATWKIATVQYNYHISTDHHNYSVPYEYIKRKVDVRLTTNMVEIFFEGNRIASHRRLYGHINQYSTNEGHMPPNHKNYVSWDSERFIRWAEKIGENTAAVIRLLLSRYRIEQQGYKSCMAMLKLADKYSAIRLEASCEKALSFTSCPSLKNIQAILISGQDKLTQETEKNEDAAKEKTEQYGFTRGAGYYRRNG